MHVCNLHNVFVYNCITWGPCEINKYLNAFVESIYLVVCHNILMSCYVMLTLAHIVINVHNISIILRYVK